MAMNWVTPIKTFFEYQYFTFLNFLFFNFSSTYEICNFKIDETNHCTAFDLILPDNFIYQIQRSPIRFLFSLCKDVVLQIKNNVM